MRLGFTLACQSTTSDTMVKKRGERLSPGNSLLIHTPVQLSLVQHAACMMYLEKKMDSYGRLVR